VELRYSATAKTRDITLSFGLGVIVGSCLFALYKDRVFEDPSFASLLSFWVLFSAPAVFLFGVWRWGRRAILDENGVSQGPPWRRLAWPEVEEIYSVGVRGFELRGHGVEIRVTDDYTNPVEGWREAGRRRGRSLENELRAALDAGGTVRFRGPVEPAMGIVRIAAALFFLLPPMMAALASAIRAPGSALVIGALVFSGWLGTILWSIVRNLLWSFGWVEIGPGGLSMRGAGRERRWAWSEIDAIAGYIVHPREGPRVKLDPGLANLHFLESLSRRWLPPAPPAGPSALLGA
jgi:hypothetical protein